MLLLPHAAPTFFKVSTTVSPKLLTRRRRSIVCVIAPTCGRVRSRNLQTVASPIDMTIYRMPGFSASIFAGNYTVLFELVCLHPNGGSHARRRCSAKFCSRSWIGVRSLLIRYGLWPIPTGQDAFLDFPM